MQTRIKVQSVKVLSHPGHENSKGLRCEDKTKSLKQRKAPKAVESIARDPLMFV